MIYHFTSLVLVRKGRAFYATLYQDVFFGKTGGGGSLKCARINQVCDYRPQRQVSYITIHSWMSYVRLVPVYCVLLEDFWHNNFINSTGQLHCFSTPIKQLVCQCARFSLSTSSLYLCLYLSIIWYVSGNMSLSNLLTHQLSEKVSLVISLSVIQELITVILIKTSTASLSVLLIY